MLEELCKIAPSMGAKQAKILNVSGAFHSPLMLAAQEALSKTLDAADIQMPSIKVGLTRTLSLTLTLDQGRTNPDPNPNPNPNPNANPNPNPHSRLFAAVHSGRTCLPEDMQAPIRVRVRVRDVLA